VSLTGLVFLACFIGAAGASLLISSGAISFYLYQFVYLFAPTQRWWGDTLPGLPFSFIASILLLGAVVIQYERTRNNSLVRVKPFLWMVLILILYVVVDFWAVAPADHRTGLMDMIKLAIVVFCAYKLLDTPKKLRMSLWFYLLGCAYIGYEAIVVGRDEFGRVEGIGPIDSPDSNGAAAVLVPAIPVILYFVWRSRGYMRYTAMLFAVLIVNALVLLNSRGAFLGVLAGGMYAARFVVLSSIITVGQRVYVVLLMVACLAGALYLTDDTFWDRMSTLQEVEDETESGSHRYRMWLATFDLVDDHPGGVGINGYQTLSQIYVDAELFFDNQRYKAVHSSWFQSLAELGWFGLFAFCSLCLSAYLAMRRVRITLRQQRHTNDYFLAVSIEAGLMSYLVVGTFIDQFRAQMLYWFILYCACAYNIYCLRNNELEPLVNEKSRNQKIDDAGRRRYRIA